MVSHQLERETYIFIVRIWHEYLTGAHPVLRGEVEDLARHTREPFAEICELEHIVLAGCLTEGQGEGQG